MRRLEADFTTKVKQWLREEMGTGAYELKHTRGKDRFYLRELKEHQKDALLAARGRHGIAYKIPDDGVAYKPFDLFVLKMTGGWVVICWPGCFTVIDAVKLADWKGASITLEEAKGLASVTRDLSVLR